MRLLKTAILAVAVGLGQGSLEIAWSFGYAPPDIFLLVVLWFGMNRRTSEALLIGFLGGLILDCVAPLSIVGVQSLCKIIVAYLPEWAFYILLPEPKLTGFMLVGTGTLIQQILLLTLVQTLKPGGVWGARALVDTVWLLFANLVAWSILVLWQASSSEGKETVK